MIYDNNYIIDETNQAYIVDEITGITTSIDGYLKPIYSGSSLGAGENVFHSKSGTTLLFKSLVAGNNITIVDNGTSLTINSTASGSTTGGTSANAIGPNMAVQFKNGSAFSGTSDITWNQTGRTLNIVGDLAISGTSFLRAGLDDKSIEIGKGSYTSSYGAGGNGSVAIGAYAVGTYSGTSVGMCARAIQTGVSVGPHAYSAYGGISVGLFSCSNSGGVALGISATTSGAGPGVAIGQYAHSSGIEGIALGTYSKADGQYSISIGRCADANSSNSIAIGCEALTCVSATGAIAIGCSTEVLSVRGIAIGNDAYASGCTAISIGSGACTTGGTALGQGRGIAIGPNAFAGNVGVAIGSTANAKCFAGVAIGSTARVCGGGGITIGCGSGIGGSAASCKSVIIGFRAGISGGIGLEGIAIGTVSNVPATGGIIIGNSGCTSGLYGVAIGHKQCANAANSLIIGGSGNTISTGNTGAALIATRGVNLTGSSFVNHVIVPNLAIRATPSAGGSSDSVLVRSTDGKVKAISQGLNFLEYALSDEVTALATGQTISIRMPYAMTLTGVRASLSTAQTSGSTLTIDIKKNGTTVLSTLLTIDNTEKTSVTAATPAVVSVASIADDDEFTFHITQKGTGAKGLKIKLFVSR